MPTESEDNPIHELAGQRASSDDLMKFAFEASAEYVRELNHRRVVPSESQLASLHSLWEELPEDSSAPETALAELKGTVAASTVASTGGRYFGFVVGGAFPVAVAANWMATTWDQNAGSWILAPSVIELEAIAASWLLDILDLPKDAAVGFVTGSTMGTFSALTAARSALLNRLGYDVKQKGLTGAPRLRIVTSEETHPTNVAALGYAGFGVDQIHYCPTDDQGRIIVESLPLLDAKTIVILQAGNINSGGFDPFQEICERASHAGSWVHVDGAFGLWARASKSKKHFTEGVDLADSWSVDGHKWLNLPQDSAIYACRDPKAVADVFATDATYLMRDHRRQPNNLVPELSRRARGVEFWAVLKTLGRKGVNELVERCCNHAQNLAQGLKLIGYEVLNNVVLNQVVFSCKDEQKTKIALNFIQESGKIWLGPTTWKARSAMRISVSSWATTKDDVEAALQVLRDAYEFAETEAHTGRHQ